MTLHAAQREIDIYYKKYRAIPKPIYLANTLDISPRNAIHALDKLVSIGYLKKEGEQYSLGDTSKKAKPETLGPEQASVGVSLPEPVKNVEKVKQIISGMNVLRAVMLFIGVVSVIVSVHFSRLFLSEFLDPVLSVLLALAIIGFSSFAPQTLGFLFSKRGPASKIVGIGMSVVIIVVMIFSLAASIIGQYNSRTAMIFKDNISEEKDSAAVAQFDLLKEKEKSIIDTIARAKKESDSMAALLSSFDKKDISTNWNYYNIESRLKTKNKEIEAQENKLENVRADIEKYLSEGKKTVKETRQKNFYDFLAGIFPVKAGLIEFIISVIPALLLDFISVLSFYVVFNGRKDNGKG
jgi:Na+-transporting methylmalonyl-CoA/oxaloacetate decarboxylase gamma subunit